MKISNLRTGTVALSCILASTLFLVTSAYASTGSYPRPPVKRNVTISNGGMSITFNIAWGAVVVSIANRNVADDLNIVDTHDVGRELQVDQFLHLRVHGRPRLIINPTQAGALGRQAFYQHPKGIRIREIGSRVIRWKATKSRFFAVIKPLDYDTGKQTRWVYVEHVRIDRRGVATFHYVFKDHDRKTYITSSEIPTLYSDRTDAFLIPLESPFGQDGSRLRRRRSRAWPVKMITGAPRFPTKALASRGVPHKALLSKGWIANVDTRDNLAIFYTTPLGFQESYGVFPGAFVSDAPPLGKTNVVANFVAHPGMSYAVTFSVLVSTPKLGPALISQQPPARFRILNND